MSKYTSGPWVANQTPYKNGLIGVGQENNIFDIAKVSGIANAYLIAAAPEMLEALKDASRELSRIQLKTGYACNVLGAHIDDLIAKAEEK